MTQKKRKTIEENCPALKRQIQKMHIRKREARTMPKNNRKLTEGRQTNLE